MLHCFRHTSPCGRELQSGLGKRWPFRAGDTRENLSFHGKCPRMNLRKHRHIANSPSPYETEALITQCYKAVINQSGINREALIIVLLGTLKLMNRSSATLRGVYLQAVDAPDSTWLFNYRSSTWDSSFNSHLNIYLWPTGKQESCLFSCDIKLISWKILNFREKN